LFREPTHWDLDSAETRAACLRVISDFVRLYDVRPSAIVHDLHPDYASSQLGEALTAEGGMFEGSAICRPTSPRPSCVLPRGCRTSERCSELSGTAAASARITRSGRRVSVWQCIELRFASLAYIHSSFRAAIGQHAVRDELALRCSTSFLAKPLFSVASSDQLQARARKNFVCSVPRSTTHPFAVYVQYRALV